MLSDVQTEIGAVGYSAVRWDFIDVGSWGIIARKEHARLLDYAYISFKPHPFSCD